VRFLAPLNDAFVDPRLATPRTIFASGVAKHSKSLRPQHTVLELATFLKRPLVLDYAKGDENRLADAAIAADGPVLISWEHEGIPYIANRIVGDSTTCPQHWSGSRLTYFAGRLDKRGCRLIDAAVRFCSLSWPSV
jgi:hypothetical protein